MKWNQYTDQAIRALVYLAESRAPAPSIEIASHLNTKQHTVIVNAAPLINTGLLDVLPGSGGGYFLAKDPASISLYEVIVLYESPSLFPKLTSGDETSQRVSLIYDFLQCATDHIFKKISIAHVAHGDMSSLVKVEKLAMNAIILAMANTNIEEKMAMKLAAGDF